MLVQEDVVPEKNLVQKIFSQKNFGMEDKKSLGRVNSKVWVGCPSTEKVGLYHLMFVCKDYIPNLRPLGPFYVV